MFRLNHLIARTVLLIGACLTLCSAQAAAQDATNFLNIDTTLNNGAAQTQGFTVSGGNQTFVLRFASDFNAEAAVISASSTQNFLNNGGYTFWGQNFVNTFGTHTITLGPGDYAVGVRNRANGSNQVRVELDFALSVPGWNYYDSPYSVAESIPANSKAWRGFSVQSGVRYFIDGCNSGLDTFIIPENQLDNFRNNLTFQYYLDYGGVGETAYPGYWELTLPPGNYYLVFRNQNPTIAKSVTYILDRYTTGGPPPAQNYTITVSASPGAGGTVSGGGTFVAGSSRTVTATANSGYSFASWTENGSVVSSSASYTFTLNGNRNLVANFTAVNYAITLNVSPSGSGTVSGAGTFAAGSSRTVTATANSGYSFVSWTENGSVVSSSASYTFTLNGNRNLVVNFITAVNYTITLNVSPSGSGTVSGAGTFAAGSSRTVTATANGGYSFASWTENGSVVSTSASYTFTLNGNRTLVANFTLTQQPLQLLLEQFGSPSSQVAALDSISFLRDPFPVLNGSDLLNLGVDRNTRVILFATNLQLTSGQTASFVKVNLTGNGVFTDIDADDVRPLANSTFTQVIFRLPDFLPAGTLTYTIKLTAPDGRVSNSGTIRIRT